MLRSATAIDDGDRPRVAGGSAVRRLPRAAATLTRVAPDDHESGRPPSSSQPDNAHAIIPISTADSALVAAVIEGAEAALEVLYSRYERPVFSLALRVTQERDLAEEITQEVFLRLWRNAASYSRERGRFGSWLLSITHHLAIDQLRRRRTRPLVVASLADLQVRDLPDRRIDVEREALAGVQRDSIRAAIAHLPPAQRLVVELAYFDELTHAQIAARLGEPMGTVKTRLRLAIGRLRVLLLSPEQPIRA